MEIQSVAVTPQTLTSSQSNNQPAVQSPAAEVRHGKVTDALHETAGKQKPVDSNTLQKAVDQANETIQNLSNELQFSVDKGTGEYVVKVVDKQTNEVVRQIPSKEMLEISKRLDELRGLLIQQKA